MKRTVLGWVVCGTLWLLGASPARGMEAPALRDSLVAWLQRGDLAAWTRACASEPAAEAVLADWGLEAYGAPTAAEWRWMQLGAEQLATVELELERNPVSPEEYVAQQSAREARPWWLANIVLAVACAGAGLWWAFERRKLRSAAREVGRSPEEVALAAYAAAPLFRRAPFPAEAWSAFLSEEEAVPVSARWALLNASERECALLLSKGVSVPEIAVELACSPSYVYNIRSSIRKKWNLAEHEDVVEAISTELKIEG